MPKESKEPKETKETKETKERKINCVKFMRDIEDRAIKYRKDPDSFQAETDIVMNELLYVKNAHDRNELNDEEKLRYKNFVYKLKSMDCDLIRKEIENRAMCSFKSIQGDLTTDSQCFNIEQANSYSDLYNLLADYQQLSREKFNYESKEASEKEMNAGIRDAIDRGDQEALDAWKERRKNTGFVDVRKQLQEEEFEKGNTFGACNAVLKELDELEHKKDRTPDEKKRYERDLKLKNSSLFGPYMLITRHMNQNPERDLYVEEKMQESLENAKEQLKKETEKRLREEKRLKEETEKRLKEESEKRLKENKIRAFEQYRDEHAAQMAAQFERFNQLFQNAQTTYTKKETADFGKVMKELNSINDYNWNENYGKNSIYEAHQNIYNKGLERALDTLDTYIQKPRFSRMMGSLAKERLEEAKEMRDLLTEIEINMKAFRSYVGEHTMETAALMDRADQSEKANQSSQIQQTVPYVPNPRWYELMQRQNSDGPKRIWSQRDGKFIDVKPVGSAVRNVKEESKPAEVPADEKKVQPNTESQFTVDVSKLSKEDQRAIDAIMKGDTWLRTLRPVQAEKVSYKTVNLKRERTSYVELKSNAAKTEKKQGKKSDRWIQETKNDMKKVQEALKKKQRPKEAEDASDIKAVSKSKANSL